MSKPAIPIQPIDFDLAERAVDRFAAARDIPTLTFPSTDAVPVTTEPARLNLEITTDVLAALKDRAHAENITIRAVVLRALHAAGIAIPEHHLGPDGRRAARGGPTRGRR